MNRRLVFFPSDFSHEEHKATSCHIFAPHASMQDDDVKGAPVPATPGPFTMDQLDQTISAFDTVEQLFRTLNPNTWRQDLDTIYNQKPLQYRSRNYLLANRLHKGERVSVWPPSGSAQDTEMHSCIQMYSLSFGANITAAGKGWRITKQLHGGRRLGIKTPSVEKHLLEAVES